MSTHLARHAGADYLRNYGSNNELFLRVWPLVERFTTVDAFRAESLMDYLTTALDKDGDLIECGVAQGGTSLLSALVLREYGSSKKLYMCDSFEGLPAPDPKFDKAYKEKQFLAEISEAQSLIREHGLENYCVFRKGMFRETLHEFAADQKFCFAHIDADLYASTVDCITDVYPRMSPDSPIVFDDYYDESGGVRLAVNELAAATSEIIFLGPTGQATIVKGVTEEPATNSTCRVEPNNNVVSGVRLSVAKLERSHPYLKFLFDHLLQFKNFASLCANAGQYDSAGTKQDGAD